MRPTMKSEPWETLAEDPSAVVEKRRQELPAARPAAEVLAESIGALAKFPSPNVDPTPTPFAQAVVPEVPASDRDPRASFADARVEAMLDAQLQLLAERKRLRELVDEVRTRCGELLEDSRAGRRVVKAMFDVLGRGTLSECAAWKAMQAWAEKDA